MTKYNTEFNGIINGIKKLNEMGYVHWYNITTDKNGFDYIRVQIYTDEYPTARKLKEECKKRNLYYVKDSTYNKYHFEIYEKDPLDVF